MNIGIDIENVTVGNFYNSKSSQTHTHKHTHLFQYKT